MHEGDLHSRASLADAARGCARTAPRRSSDENMLERAGRWNHAEAPLYCKEHAVALPMKDVPQRHRYSYADYLRLEEFANVKHEFIDGEIIAMAGGTIVHGRLAADFIIALSSQLKPKGCRFHTSDVRVRVQASAAGFYPDVTVVCGDSETDPVDANGIVNPTLVVEITSDSTEEFDRGEKLEHYQRIPSLRAIVLVSHREKRLDVWERESAGEWMQRTASAGEVLELASPACKLDVDEIYAEGLEE